MTRSTDPNKINLLLSQNLFPPTSCLYQILAYPTSYNGCVPEINFLLNTVDNSDNALWGSYKRNLLFQGIPKFFFTSDSFLSLSLQTRIFRIEWRAEVARSSTPILCVSKAGGSATEGSTQVLNEVALEKSQRDVISEDEENALL